MQKTDTVEYPLKYRFIEYLDKMGRNDRKDTMIALQKELRLSKSQLYRLLKLEQHSVSSATTDQLIIFSRVLNVPVEDLLNYPQTQNYGSKQKSLPRHRKN